MNVIIRGQVFDFIKNPAECERKEDCFRFFEDGGLVIENGLVKDIGEYEIFAPKYSNFEVIDYSGNLIMPGFIDTHIHYPQTEIIGSYGKQLINWLEEYTFPVEKGFSQPEYAENIADLFISELLRNGTTSCMTYATSDKVSVDAVFKAASKYNLRFIAGKVLMNRNAPVELCDNVESANLDCEYLIDKWHKKGRNHYAITPRFAISSDTDELKLAAQLHLKYPDTYIQTHLAENIKEIELTKKLFPDCSDYLNVYEKAGLVTSRSFFAHCIHLSESELKRLSTAGSVAVHCPSSNLFLGSGLFDLRKTVDAGVEVCIATDVGAGTSFSLLKTLGDAYKVQQLNGYSLDPFESFYRITLGAAIALKLDQKIGSFRIGNEADFVVIDYSASEILKYRMDYLIRNNLWDVEKMLFSLITMGDDRNVVATYLMGKKVDIDKI